jgi:hypothetical protein
VTGTAPITSTGGPTPAIGITAATELAAGSMSAADKAKLDALGPGPIYPRTLSNTGTGAAAIAPNNIEVGSIYAASSAFIVSLVFSPLQFTRGVAPSTRSFGPFVWGARGNAADIFRFDVDNFLIDVVSLDDVSPEAELGGAQTNGGIAQGVVVVDGAGNAWAIETTSNTLVKIQAEAPQVAQTFPIPNSPKNLLAYDSVHDALILLGGRDFPVGATTIATFDISTGIFSADVAVGVGTQAPSSLFFAVDGAAPKGGWVFVGSSTPFASPSTNDIFKLDPVTLATLATASFVSASGGAPVGFGYETNAPNPKLLVSLSSTTLARIDVNAMTVDAIGRIGAASSLAGIAISLDGSLWITDSGVTDPPSSVFYQLTKPLLFVTGPIAVNTYRVSLNTDAIPGADTDSIVLVPAYVGNFGAVAAQFALASDETDEVTLIFADLTGFPAPTPNVNDWIDIAGFLNAIPPGPTGQVLTSQGPGQLPAWQPPVSGGVTAVTGTAPITSSGGTTPDIAITPATDLAAGSMSAADKTKLDTLISAQNGGVALGGGPWETINALGTLVASDGGGGVLDLTASGSAGTPPFFDNAVAKRTTTTAWYRRNGQASTGPGVLHTTIPNIPALVDGTGANNAETQFFPLLAGAGLAVIGDNVYVTGNDNAGGGAPAANDGALYGFNKLTQQSLTAAATPIHRYGSGVLPTNACPNQLLGVRITVAGVNTDYIFAACQKFVELGTLTGGGAVYTQVYQTVFAPEFRADSVFQGAVQAVCLNQPLTGVDTTTPPWFAFVDSNAAAALWTVSPTGTVTLAFSPSASHLFQAICVDDDGFVWAVENGGGSTLLHKLSVNYGTATFTNVATVALTGGNNLTTYNVTSDGRYICVLSAVAPSGVQIAMIDRESATEVRTITVPGTPSAPINLGYPTRMAFDDTAMWVAIGFAGTSDADLHVYYVQTESGEVLMDLGPYAPGGGNQSNRHIVVCDDGTVIISTISGASSLALVYTSTNVPTVHARSVVVADSVVADSNTSGYVAFRTGIQSEPTPGFATPLIGATGGITAAAFVGNPNQTAGQVSLTSSGAAGTASVTMAVAAPSGSLRVVLTPTNALAAAAGAQPFVTSASGNQFTINMPAVPAGVYTWNYICVG